jgi:hypothetical protein
MTAAQWLADEFGAAAVAATAEHYAALIAAGVPRAFLYRGACRFGVAAIEPEGDFYQPVPGGDLAFIVPALPIPAPWEPRFPDEDPSDLVAWLPQEPRRWWCRTGLLPVINPSAIDYAAHFRERLAVHASPLSWLKAEGAGIVIVSRHIDLRFWLAGVPAVTCETAALGKAIERTLYQRPRNLPDVLVPRKAA